MRALIIYESMFGNTQQVADAVGEGLARILPADIVEVGQAPQPRCPWTCRCSSSAVPHTPSE
jgi:menaquinone-dependent protoporphyrinogen IX oxidase